MNWPPDVSKLPAIIRDPLEMCIARIDGNEPKDGHGARVSDATGRRGKIIDASPGGGNSGVPLKDCVFYDPEGGEAMTGEFFYTDVYTTGRRTPIPPPEEP